MNLLRCSSLPSLFTRSCLHHYSHVNPFTSTTRWYSSLSRQLPHITRTSCVSINLSSAAHRKKYSTNDTNETNSAPTVTQEWLAPTDATKLDSLPTSSDTKLLLTCGFKSDHPDERFNMFAKAFQLGMDDIVLASLNTINIHGLDSFGNNLLHFPSSKTHEQVVRVLIQLGLSVDSTNSQGVTPLGMAAGRGNLAAMRIFKEHGAQINVQDKSGHTPLHYACRTSLEAVNLLVEWGADVHIKNNKGVTALDLAVTPEIAKSLLVGGADVSTSITPQALHELVESFEPEFLRVFLEAGAKHTKADGTKYTLEELIESKKGETSLLGCAAYNGKLSTVKMLLEMGASVTDSDPINLACAQGHTEIVKVLLQYGARPDPMATTHAADLGHIGVFEELAKIEPKLLQTPHDNITPLMGASRRGQLECARRLVELGADPGAKDRHGFDAMNLAAFNGHMHVVEYFIKEVKLPPSNLRKAFAAAVVTSDIPVLERIYHLNKDQEMLRSSNLVSLAVRFGEPKHKQREVIELLLKLGVDIDERDKGKHDQTPLMAAAASINGGPEPVELLLKLGANPEARDSAGNLAVTYARDPERLQPFLDAGVKPLLPYMLHMHCKYPITSMVKRLMELGGREHLETKDEDDCTPLLLSAKWGIIDTFNYLVQEGANYREKGSSNSKDALQLACSGFGEKGSLEVMKECIKLGISANDPNPVNNTTPLCMAVLYKFFEGADLLLSQGADIDAKDFEGDTCLNTVVFVGYSDSVRYLLERGARTDIKNNKDQLPIDIAKERAPIVGEENMAKVIELLANHKK